LKIEAPALKFFEGHLFDFSHLPGGKRGGREYLSDLEVRR